MSDISSSSTLEAAPDLIRLWNYAFGGVARAGAATGPPPPRSKEDTPLAAGAYFVGVGDLPLLTPFLLVFFPSSATNPISLLLILTLLPPRSIELTGGA